MSLNTTVACFEIGLVFYFEQRLLYFCPSCQGVQIWTFSSAFLHDAVCLPQISYSSKMFECQCCSNKCLKGGKLTGNVIVTTAETNRFMCRKPQNGCKCIVDSTKEAETSSSGLAISSFSLEPPFSPDKTSLDATMRPSAAPYITGINWTYLQHQADKLSLWWLSGTTKRKCGALPWWQMCKKSTNYLLSVDTT